MEPDHADLPPAIDWPGTLERFGGMLQMLNEFSEVAKRETIKLSGEIRRAIANEDAKALRRAAHTMKSSVTYFGADALAKVALHLEYMGRDETFVGIEQAQSTLNHEMARFLAALAEGPPQSAESPE